MSKAEADRSTTKAILDESTTDSRGESVRELVRDHGLRPADLAAATGADERTVRRWLQTSGQVRRSVYDDRIDAVHGITYVLAKYMAPSVVRSWLRSPNPYLENLRPADLLVKDRFTEVLLAAQAATHGALPQHGTLTTPASETTPAASPDPGPRPTVAA